MYINEFLCKKYFNFRIFSNKHVYNILIHLKTLEINDTICDVPKAGPKIINLRLEH